MNEKVDIRVHFGNLADLSVYVTGTKGLKSAAGYLRRELGRVLTLRYTPELQFIEDDSIERGVRMVSMIDRVLEEDEEK